MKAASLLSFRAESRNLSFQDECDHLMKAGYLEKLIERLGRISPEDVQNYFLRLAQEKGFLETVFNAIQEGIIVTDSKARITYLNDAACGVFGLEASEAIGKRLDERI